jgi:uncharacterized protein DUF4430
VLRRSFLALVLMLPALAACGGGSSTLASSGTSTLAEQATVVITRDCGKRLLLKRTTVPAGDTAMRALDRVAEIEADSGGKFVTGINGVEQNTGKKLAWLYYINGKAADKGATEVKLAVGDVEWWDLHDYEHECATVPAIAQ